MGRLVISGTSKGRVMRRTLAAPGDELAAVLDELARHLEELLCLVHCDVCVVLCCVVWRVVYSCCRLDWVWCGV